MSNDWIATARRIAKEGAEALSPEMRAAVKQSGTADTLQMSRPPASPPRKVEATS
jgi:hypothetical protein